MSDVQIAVVDQQDTQIVLAVPGVQGATGSEIPTGGTADQVLRKSSSTNYDTNWSQVTSAMIADGTIVNADINASAAIAGTKISPDFGSQNVVTTGTSTAASFIPTSSTVPTNGVYLPAANSVALSTNGTGRLFVDANGTVRVNSATQATSDGGLNVEVTSNGSSSAPFTLQNRGTSNGTGVFLTYRGLSSASAETDYAYMQMLATDTSSRQGAIAFWTANGGSVNERLRITSAGLVGIGTSSPSKLLTIGNSSTANTTVRLNCSQTAGSDTGMYSFGIDDSTDFAGMRLDFTDRTSKGLQIFTAPGFGYPISFSGSSGNQDVTIDTSGRVGIGTTSPTQRLQITDGSLSNFYIAPGYNSGQGTLLATGGSEYLAFATNGLANERARIDSSGRLLVGTSTVLGTGGLDVLYARDSYASGLYTGQLGAFDTSAYNSGPVAGVCFGFKYNAAGSYVVAGNVQLLKENATDGNFASAMRFLTRGSTGDVAERLRIDSSGRLLVGTSSTSAAANILVAGGDGARGVLNIASTAATPANGDDLGFITFNDSSHIYNSALIRAQRDGGTWTATTSKPTRLTFSTTADGASSPTERLRITQAGNVLVGTTDSSLGGANGLVLGPLESSLTVSNAGNVPLRIYNKDTSGTRYCIEFRSASAAVGSITHDGTNTSYATSSDYRLKENVTAATNGIARLQQLKPSRFNFIADPAKTVDGFIAHEVQAVVPEAITGQKDAVDADGNPVYQGIDQSKLVPLLTAALQEAVAKIESLEARLTAAGI